LPSYSYLCRQPKCSYAWDFILPVATFKAHKARGWDLLQCPRCGTRAPKLQVTAPAVIGAKSIVLDPNGAGTPPELQGRVFSSFAEVDAAKAEMGLFNCGTLMPRPPESQRVHPTGDSPDLIFTTQEVVDAVRGPVVAPDLAAEIKAAATAHAAGEEIAIGPALAQATQPRRGKGRKRK